MYSPYYKISELFLTYAHLEQLDQYLLALDLSNGSPFPNWGRGGFGVRR